MKVGDIIWDKQLGIGKIVAFEYIPSPCKEILIQVEDPGEGRIEMQMMDRALWSIPEETSRNPCVMRHDLVPLNTARLREAAGEAAKKLQWGWAADLYEKAVELYPPLGSALQMRDKAALAGLAKNCRYAEKSL